jgi:RsiW-degrading membrane proteinase PrsW (M82 family)
MIIKIIIYFLFVFGATFGLLSTKIDPGTFAVSILLLYIGSFLILLGLEIRSQLLRKVAKKEIRKAAFWFSFWVGVCLGTLTTFYRGYPTFYRSLEQTIAVILGCLLGGGLIGIVGVAVSYIIVPLLGGLRDGSKKVDQS